MFKLVEKKNHLAGHGYFCTKEAAEYHLKSILPKYLENKHFAFKGLKADDFEIIENKPLKRNTFKGHFKSIYKPCFTKLAEFGM